MDGDDVALARRLELQVDALTREALAICGGQVRYLPDHVVKDGLRRYEAWINELVTPEQASRDVFVECPIPHPALAARAEAIAHVGGSRGLGWAEDYDPVLRIWAIGGTFPDVDEPWP